MKTAARCSRRLKANVLHHMPPDLYSKFADLAAAQIEGKDYSRTVHQRDRSSAVVIAPHGGAIEFGTSEVATEIAGENHNLYVFAGTKSAGNYAVLHITSHRFDDPKCLKLVGRSDRVIAVHGCSGENEEVLLGGLDQELVALIAQELSEAGVVARTSDHSFPGTKPTNICNLGRTRRGVQLELSAALRQSTAIAAVAPAVRRALAQVG